MLRSFTNSRNITLSLALALAGALQCTVSESYTVRSYALDEGQRVKRLVLAAIPPIDAGNLPEGTLTMFQGVVREFVSHHHEYILLSASVLPVSGSDRLRSAGATSSIGRAQPPAAIEALCQAQYDGRRTHGVLLSAFDRLAATGDSVEYAVEARLIDCETGLLVWRAKGGNTYPKVDDSLEQTVRGYTNRYGEAVRDYVAGAYLLSRKLYESMPDPALNEDDIIEKIELDSLVD